jgi:ABC-type polysaccharide/polyol phosphate export permease
MAANQTSELVYDSAARHLPVVEEIRELLQYRNLLTQLVARNIKTRYKRSVLGIAWTMLNPLLTMGILWVVFSNLFVTTVPHYSVYILSGLVFWSFFSLSTSAIMNDLIWGGSLLKRIYVPRTIFALSAVATAMVNLVLALVPLAIFMVISGAPFTPALLFLPVSILMIAGFSLGLGLWLSTLAIQFTDVVEMYQILLTAWLYLTPIIYPITIIPEEYRWLFMLNPIYHLLECFRLPLQAGRLPDASTFAMALGCAVVALVGGSVTFVRKADEIAYRV